MHRTTRPTVPRVPVTRSFSVPAPLPPAKPSVPREGYSIAETAAALGVSVSTVKRLIGNGDLESVAVLTRRIIPVWSLRKFLGG
jgi:excisionase family DNA binding protein